MKQIRIFSITLFCVALCFSGRLMAADWPMFHGPDGDNHSQETGLLTSWPEDGPKLLWQIDGIGAEISGYSSVTIQNGRLFTTGSIDGKSIVYCFDLAGKKLWEYENGPVWEGSYHGTRSTPTIDGDRVYDYSSLGELVCLNVETGQKIWGRNILADFEGENIIWALAESIRIDGDVLYCQPGGPKAAIVALNKMTGELVWATSSLGEKTSYTSPTLFTQDGLRILATMNAKGLVGVNADTGELLFTFEHLQRYDINCTRVLYHEGHLFITNAATPPNKQGGVMLKVTVQGKKASVSEVWRNANFDNLHDSILLLDGYLYGTSYEYKGGIFMCVDWKTGETVYEKRDVGKGSLTWAEGLIYFLSEKGDMLLIRPNPEEYTVVSRFNIQSAGEGPTWPHPVICDKKLYIRHATFLYCYDIAGE